MSSLTLGLAVSRVSEGIIRFPTLQLPPYMRRIATCKDWRPINRQNSTGKNNHLPWKQKSHHAELDWPALVSYIPLLWPSSLHGDQSQDMCLFLRLCGKSVLYLTHGMGFPLNENFLYEKRGSARQVETQKLTPSSFTSHLKGRLTEWVSWLWTFRSESQAVVTLVSIRNKPCPLENFPPSSGMLGLKQWHQWMSWSHYFAL